MQCRLYIYMCVCIYIHIFILRVTFVLKNDCRMYIRKIKFRPGKIIHSFNSKRITYQRKCVRDREEGCYKSLDATDSVVSEEVSISSFVTYKSSLSLSLLTSLISDPSLCISTCDCSYLLNKG